MTQNCRVSRRGPLRDSGLDRSGERRATLFVSQPLSVVRRQSLGLVELSDAQSYSKALSWDEIATNDGIEQRDIGGMRSGARFCALSA
jgi:hypothetical protein